MLLGVPAALIASLLAIAHAPDRGFAITALVLSALEALLLVVTLVLSLVIE